MESRTKGGPIRMTVLISGNGTNLQALIDASTSTNATTTSTTRSKSFSAERGIGDGTATGHVVAAETVDGNLQDTPAGGSGDTGENITSKIVTTSDPVDSHIITDMTKNSKQSIHKDETGDEHEEDNEKEEGIKQLPRTKIVRVISNRKAAYGLTRAAQAGIPTRYHNILPYRRCCRLRQRRRQRQLEGHHHQVVEDPARNQGVEEQEAAGRCLCGLHQDLAEVPSKTELNDAVKGDPANRRGLTGLKDHGVGDDKNEDEHGQDEGMTEVEIEVDPQRARRAYDSHLAQMVLEDDADVVVCAGWMHVLGPSFLVPLRRRQIPVLNLHPARPGEYDGVDAIARAWHHSRSLLRAWEPSSSFSFSSGSIATATAAPALSAMTMASDPASTWRASASSAALINNTSTTNGVITKPISSTGVMLHHVIDEVDRGVPILLRDVPIYAQDTLDDLEQRMHTVEWEVIVQGTALVVQELISARQPTG